jgi:N-acetylmuramic acid 6-phosphate etherase
MKLSSPPLFLGIEGGGSRTVAILADADHHLVQRLELGPANLRLLTDPALGQLLRTVARAMPEPVGIAIGLAGARTEQDFDRIRVAAARIWPGIPCCATHDLETALAAAPAKTHPPVPRVLVLSGTGSCCLGRTPAGTTVKVGGWGHVLGDQGSGYDIGLLALRSIVSEHDTSGKWPRLGQHILRALALNQPEELIDWVQSAAKADMAALAREVFRVAQVRDPLALKIIRTAAVRLACMALDCARLLGSRPGPVEFVLAGGLLQRQPLYARGVRRAILQGWAPAFFCALDRESAWGAVQLAQEFHRTFAQPTERSRLHRETHAGTSQSIRRSTSAAPKPGLELSPQEMTGLSVATTEQRNPRSMNLDRMPLRAAIRLMLDEEARANRAVLAEAASIEKAIRLIERTFRKGGRLFYVGAGTSGRLGVLDAGECPPTFHTPPDQVQGIIAGGQRALWQAVEGAEDAAEAGVRAIQFRGISRKDVVIGIAASGRTPFVLAALKQARALGAPTVLVCFNPAVRFSGEDRPTVLILPQTGPEVLTGSTRLKAGTATKLILNMFTTLSLARLGKVVSNLMVDVHPTNAKLRHRAIRIFQALTGTEPERARRALEHSGWEIRRARRYLRD